MKIDTNWVSLPQSIGGLDHLGTQAPCVLIYSQLLPNQGRCTQGQNHEQRQYNG